MSETYRRCQFVSKETGMQCDTWFPAQERATLCPIHQDAPAINGTGPAKQRYIDSENQWRKLCNQMSREELDEHIATLEVRMIELRHETSVTRAVRAEKLDSLTEEERRELRKQRIEVKISEAVKTSAKKDPIVHLQKKHNLSADMAKDLMSMDMDALMAKYKKEQK